MNRSAFGEGPFARTFAGERSREGELVVLGIGRLLYLARVECAIFGRRYFVFQCVRRTIEGDDRACSERVLNASPCLHQDASKVSSNGPR